MGYHYHTESVFLEEKLLGRTMVSPGDRLGCVSSSH
jgi:hypothetical protein